MTPLDKAKTRIYFQDRSHQENVDFLTIMPKVALSADSALNDIQDILSIDRSKNLDLIGRVVVQDRSLVVDVAMPVVRFGDDGQTDNVNYTRYGVAQYGNAQYQPLKYLKVNNRFGDTKSRFSQKTIKDDAAIYDEYYRLILKSKVVKNTSSATLDEIITAVKYIAPSADSVEVIDGEDMSFGLRIYGKISAAERYVLKQKNVVPEPQGVKYTGFIEVFDLTRSGDKSNRFGDESSQFAGYKGA